ncbi:antibiotic biosynthesis monooxygenase [Roseobacter ponti]|uniref:ABM domain-containing protein n=1 Tax=Roseobacter ponti TaxID=1891787 RepID=A0A858SS81_9RHOB|nr:antibiotic biosynthesis monooxygenase [Roseobacter ponti]QJF50847.1 hypothetical protein G3256_06585 [Roseobacter ponti]
MTDALVRRWEAVIARDDVDPWLSTFRNRVYPAMRAVEGFRGITVHTERGSDPCRIAVVTRWKDIAAVKRIAGDVPEKTFLPDFMVPFFPAWDKEASFHDEVLSEMMP